MRSLPYRPSLLVLVPDDLRETFGLEARPADQPPVDVRLPHQLRDVLGFDTAAVEDLHPVRDLRSGDLRDDLADESVHLLRRFGGGGSAGADRPYGFVSGDSTGQMGGCQP